MFDKIVSFLGGNLFKGVNDLVSRFVTDPTKLAELKHELALLQINATNELMKLETQDRDSARKRQMETKDLIPSVLAVLITMGFFGGTFYFAYWPVDPQAESLIHDMLLTLRDGWFAVIMFYFGSSLGSYRKTMQNGNGNGK